MNFKNNFICCLFFTIASLPLTAFSQAYKGFTIDGHLGGLQKGEKVILARYTAEDMKLNRSATRFDSCRVSGDGVFHLKDIAPEGGPYGYVVTFDDVNHVTYDKQLDKNIGGAGLELLVDNGQAIRISGGDINKMNKWIFQDEVTIEGSPTQTALMTLNVVEDIADGMISAINRAIKKMSDSVGYDRSLVQGLLQAKATTYDQLRYIFLQRGLKPYFKPVIPQCLISLDSWLNDHPALVMDVYNSLDDRAKSSMAGQELKKRAVLAVGQPLPSFTLPTPDGTMISLKDFVAKNKITIVHFWASNIANDHKDWLDGCQQELRVAYKKYHDRGLDIIGVSADSIDYIWKGFVQRQNYPWVNVSDLKGNLKGGMVQDVYLEGGHSVANITNVLLDHEGKILAWDPQGPVLQWYLWKYLGE